MKDSKEQTSSSFKRSSLATIISIFAVAVAVYSVYVTQQNRKLDMISLGHESAYKISGYVEEYRQLQFSIMNEKNYALSINCSKSNISNEDINKWRVPSNNEELKDLEKKASEVINFFEEVAFGLDLEEVYSNYNKAKALEGDGYKIVAESKGILGRHQSAVRYVEHYCQL